MQRYETLVKDYPLSKHTYKSHSTALASLKAYKTQLNTLALRQPKLVAKTAKLLNELPRSKKLSLKLAIEKSTMTHNNAYLADKVRLSSIWRNVSTTNMASIKEAQATVERQLVKSAHAKTLTNPDAGSFFFAANWLIEGKKFSKAAVTIDHLEKIGFPTDKIAQLRKKSAVAEEKINLVVQKRQREAELKRKLARLKRSYSKATMKDVLRQENRRKQATLASSQK